MATSRETKTKKRSAAATNGDKPHVAKIDPEQLLEFYRKMVLVRSFEEACQTAFRQGKVGGYLHVYIGQEAIATGLLATVQPDDRIITAYRDHAHVLILGSDPKAVMAELYGKGAGLVKGKGGSMHLFDVQNHFWGGYGIVGGHIPLGVGMAYAQRYLPGNHGVTQLYLGDGAIHNGAFHEGANLAGLWGREGLNPCLFVLENNQYGMGTSIERATANTNLISKFDSYAIPRETVDGMDVEAVYEAAVRLTEQVRETGAPYALEAMTYRIAPHGAADFLEKYRSKEEVREARKRDPIGLTETKLLDRDIVSEDDIAKIREEFQQVAADAVKFAEESPEPSLDELLTDVYAEPAAVEQ
jgi:pyruvate dehydrogenase E1 component alpha subunit